MAPQVGELSCQDQGSGSQVSDLSSGCWQNLGLEASNCHTRMGNGHTGMGNGRLL